MLKEYRSFPPAREMPSTLGLAFKPCRSASETLLLAQAYSFEEVGDGVGAQVAIKPTCIVESSRKLFCNNHGAFFV
ncbi:MAG: hypothetical protein C4562_02740 [Actinobacteria bacterium]|nr:MAG: hypothetical protein C4562_02740 [Actinomycetota bacterium]